MAGPDICIHDILLDPHPNPDNIVICMGNGIIIPSFKKIIYKSNFCAFVTLIAHLFSYIFYCMLHRIEINLFKKILKLV